MIRRITLTLSLLFAVGALSAQVKFHTGEISQLYAEAKSSDNLVFMDLYASWCPPCKMMERDVFSREDVGEFMAKNFVSAKYNVDEKIGGELSRQYGVSSIPTYLIFNKDGQMVGRITGAMSYKEFIANMQQIIDKQ